jgi:hypothetical protein
MRPLQRISGALHLALFEQPEKVTILATLYIHADRLPLFNDWRHTFFLVFREE